MSATKILAQSIQKYSRMNTNALFLNIQWTFKILEKNGFSMGPDFHSNIDPDFQDEIKRQVDGLYDAFKTFIETCTDDELQAMKVAINTVSECVRKTFVSMFEEAEKEIREQDKNRLVLRSKKRLKKLE